jgi:Spy/CpxP family protein refolding chaperone
MRMTVITIIIAIVVALVIIGLPRGAARGEGAVSPYAGQQTRAIKALSAQEVDDLLEARGMALAKPAELNGYPGPLHAIEMKDQLGLSARQAVAIVAIKSREDEAARALGADIVKTERELDQAFATRSVSERQVRNFTRKLGEMQGRLRALHLIAHLETTAVLTPAQVARYNELRGYAAAPAQNGPSSPVHDREKLKQHGG